MSKYEPPRGQPGPARVVREGPADRVGHREHPAAAGPEHPGHLGHHPVRVGHERDRPVGAERQVEAAVRERQRPGVALHERAEPGVPEHPGRLVGGHHLGAPPAEPVGALRGTGPDLQHPPPGHLAEQAGVGLVQPLRAPDQPARQEVTVLGQVVVGGRVPPAPVAAGALRGSRLPVPRRPQPVLRHPAILPRTVRSTAAPLGAAPEWARGAPARARCARGAPAPRRIGPGVPQRPEGSGPGAPAPGSVRKWPESRGRVGALTHLSFCRYGDHGARCVRGLALSLIPTGRPPSQGRRPPTSGRLTRAGAMSCPHRHPVRNGVPLP